MMNLHPHNRFHIPNGLAIFAALLLLISSVVGFEASQELYSSSQEIMTPVKAESSESENINDAVEHKRRGLNLGLLLFRRG